MPYTIETLVESDVNQTPLGVVFPFNGPAVFRSSYTTNEQAKTNLISLLLTSRGERIMQPNFGTSILSALFNPIGDEIVTELQEDIRQAINFWLPYMRVDTINVITEADDPTLNHSIQISVSVTVTNTNANVEVTLFANQNGIIEIQG